ncbi:MAG: phosphatidate cytidylyltransferase [Lachnospiraceae bacterium]|nr:phosphatidate cytidylyltransferase [Lachnospiraceae bacterium]
MFIKRLISGIILVLMIALMNVAGGPVMALLLAAISVIGLREFYRATDVTNDTLKKDGVKPFLPEITGIAATIIYYAAILIVYTKAAGASGSEEFQDQETVFGRLMICVVLILFMVLMSEYVFCFPKLHGDTVIKAFFGFVYVPVMLSFVFLLRAMPHGAYLVWLIYIVSWVCDTCAYCVGMLIGKHRLAPVLSPKKSVEGAVGGVAGSAVVAALFSYILERNGLIPQGHIWIFVIIGIAGSVISQIGDLTASAFKRNYDIKDYGDLIPGHGGILDRFDSVLFSAPVIYLIAICFLRLW